MSRGEGDILLYPNEGDTMVGIGPSVRISRVAKACERQLGRVRNWVGRIEI